MNPIKPNKQMKRRPKPEQPERVPIVAPDANSMTDAMKRELAQWALVSLTRQRYSSATHTVLTPPDEVIANPNVVSSLVVPKDGSKSLLIQYPIKTSSSPNSLAVPKSPAAPPTSPDIRAQLSQQLDHIDMLCDGRITHPAFDHLVIRDTAHTQPSDNDKDKDN